MNILRKITDYKHLENSQKNLYERVYFTKIASLQYTESSSTLKRHQHRPPIDGFTKNEVFFTKIF